MKRGKNAPPTPKESPSERTRPFPPRPDFSSLSVRDLLEARDAYHVYLSSLENVVATAVGRYRIHERDWYANSPPDVRRPSNFARITQAKTLANTVVRPWSWPCVLVFVRQWNDGSKHAKKHTPSDRDLVPRSLYLPDGRVVPTCVVLAKPDETPAPSVAGPSQVSELLGGGYSCLRSHQGAQNVGTLGCLAHRDGSYYAITSRHVAGGEGEVVKAYVHGDYQRIGSSTDLAVGRVLVPQVFRNWPGQRTYLTLDAALVRIDDVNAWTAQVFGVGEIGPIFDATEDSVSLDLIGLPVRAFGGTSGVMEGEIQALFYRYQSLGGFDEATDVLIGPRPKPSNGTASALPSPPLTLPGDSGAIWFYDPPRKAASRPHEDFDQDELAPEWGARARRLRPVAMQWGGQRTRMPDGSTSAYALGSFLSTVCRQLDAEIVRDWSTGHDEYWGKIGHFAIGWKACDLVSGKLGKLMKANQVRIGFDDATIGQGSEFRVGRDGFVPLADVPDYVWITSRRATEPVQHFADVDIYDIEGGETLLQRCVEDSSNISASLWQEYFDGFAEKGVGPEEGVLPFRVWQIWDAMVAYLRKKDVLRFVAAAGVLAHYVGDASQPLHSSWLHHGVPPTKKVGGRKYPLPRDSDEFQEFKETRAAQIHAIYEQRMLEVDTAEALADVNRLLRNKAPRAPRIESGFDAARATIGLMQRAQKRLPPMDLIKADDPEEGPKARAEALWNSDRVREATIASLVDSVRVLAAMWKTAWRVGGGEKLAAKKLVRLREADLDRVVRRDRTFVPSYSLKRMAQTGDFEPE